MRRILTIIVISILLGSCTTSKKAKKYAYSHKDELAEWCAECFPVKESEITPGKTIFIPGDTLITTDTVKVQVDCPDGTKADCPPAKIVTVRDTVVRTDTIKIRDTAKETVLSNNNNNLKIDVAERDREIVSLKDRNKKLNYALMILGGLIAVGLFVRFW